jgi:hypothetical protein
MKTLYILLYIYIILYRERPLSSLYMYYCIERPAAEVAVRYVLSNINMQEYIQSSAHRGI